MADGSMQGIFPPEDLDIEGRWLTTGYEEPVDPEELAEAVRRLTFMQDYTRHQGKLNEYIRRDRQRGGIKWQEENERLINSIVVGVYGSVDVPEYVPEHDVPEGYNALGADGVPMGYHYDKTTLKRYMGHEAIKLVPQIMEKRTRILGNLQLKYRTERQRTSLAEALSVILVYRAGLPFIQIAGTTSEHNYSEITSETKAYLEPRENPDTKQELASFYRWNLYNPYFHEWSPFSGDRTEYSSPFHQRFEPLEIPYGFNTYQSFRKKIYKSHPITILVDKLYDDPYVLADILRISNSEQRNRELYNDYIGRIETAISDANTEIENDFTVDWNSSNPLHYKYNWHNYQPLLLTASYNLHEGSNDAIEFLVKNYLIPEMMNNTPIGMIDNALTAVSLLSLMGGLVGRGIAAGAIWTARILMGIGAVGGAASTVGGVLVAGYRLYDTLVNAPASQSRETIITALDPEITAFENNSSALVAGGMFFLEVIMALPPAGTFRARTPPGPDIPSPSTVSTSTQSPRLIERGINSLDDDLALSRGSSWSDMSLSDPLDLRLSRDTVSEFPENFMPGQSVGDMSFSDADRLATPYSPYQPNPILEDFLPHQNVSTGSSSRITSPNSTSGVTEDIIETTHGSARRLDDATEDMLDARRALTSETSAVDSLVTNTATKRFTGNPNTYTEAQEFNDAVVESINIGSDQRLVDFDPSLSDHVAELHEAGAFFYINSKGNLLYRMPGTSSRSLVFDGIRGGVSARRRLRLDRFPPWRVLLEHWEEKGLLRKITDEANIEDAFCMVYDPNYNTWMPLEFVDRGHIEAAVKFNHRTRRIRQQWEADPEFQGWPPEVQEEFIEGHIATLTDDFVRDLENLRPEYAPSNRRLGSRMPHRYDDLDSAGPMRVPQYVTDVDTFTRYGREIVEADHIDIFQDTMLVIDANYGHFTKAQRDEINSLITFPMVHVSNP